MKAFSWAAAAIVALAAAPSIASDAGLDLQKVAGVYKHRFDNGDVDGRTYTSEDVVEVVPLDPASAYVRAELKFYNGHTCSIAGVARAEHGALIFRPQRESWQDEQCVLGISFDARHLTFHDPGATCHDYCGMRGGFDGIDLPVVSRRPIRYMSRLKASREFRAALAEDARANP